MPLKKRTIRLKGHNTSVALEPEFWAALENLAVRRGQSAAQLITAIDAARQTGLASALRLAVLEDLQKARRL